MENPLWVIVPDQKNLLRNLQVGRSEKLGEWSQQKSKDYQEGRQSQLKASPRKRNSKGSQLTKECDFPPSSLCRREAGNERREKRNRAHDIKRMPPIHDSDITRQSKTPWKTFCCSKLPLRQQIPCSFQYTGQFPLRISYFEEIHIWGTTWHVPSKDCLLLPSLLSIHHRKNTVRCPFYL